MVIFIGGASCSGKTVMAQHIMERYHIPYVSIDHIKMGLIRTGVSKKVGAGFSWDNTDDEITEMIWPIIREMAKTVIENNQHLIIEGCYIPQDKVKDFPEEYKEFIVSMYITFSDSYIDENYEYGILAHLSEVECRDKDEGYMTIDNFKKMHRAQRSRCIENGAKYFEVTDHYDTDLAKAYQWIAMQINEKIDK